MKSGSVYGMYNKMSLSLASIQVLMPYHSFALLICARIVVLPVGRVSIGSPVVTMLRRNIARTLTAETISQ